MSDYLPFKMNDVSLKLENLKGVLGEIDSPKVIRIFSGLFATWFTYKLGEFIVYKNKYKHIPGPPANGPISYFIGNVWEAKKYYDNKDKGSLDYFEEMIEKYGTTFKFQFFNNITIWTIDPEAVKEILISKNYPRTESFLEPQRELFGVRLLGQSLITDPSDASWKHRRGLSNPGFHKNVLSQFISEFNLKADVLLEKLKKKADGLHTVDLYENFKRVTLDAIAQIAFGMDIDSVNDEPVGRELKESVNVVIRSLDHVAKNPLLMYSPSMKKEFRKGINFIRTTGRERILKRIEEGNFSERNDILSNILKNWKDSEMDLEQMVDDFVLYFFGGQETTSIVLGYVFHFLGRNPNILQRAREEVKRVIGDRKDISYQNAIDLKYCSAIFKETSRLFPSVLAIERNIHDSVTMSGFAIPKGSSIILSTYLAGRHEEFFVNNAEFNPDRFMKDSGMPEVKNYTYYPFSLGPRNCIGQNFAQIEGMIMIAKLVHNFDFELINKDQPIKYHSALNTQPEGGVQCTLTLRD